MGSPPPSQKPPPNQDLACSVSGSDAISSPYPRGFMMPRAAVVSISLVFVLGALFYYQSTYTSKEMELLSLASNSYVTNATNPPPPSPSPNKPPLSSRIGGRWLPRAPFFCPSLNKSVTCGLPSRKEVTTLEDADARSPCPEYFRWIHEDLRPWWMTGITREMVERAGRTANFRVVILKGKLYIESYLRGFQTRDTFDWWGLVQLMKRYAHRLPDLDLVFNCGDIPVIRAKDFAPNSGKPPPPPLFRFCKDGETLDIPFPDWSFWGWPEINIKPWVPLLEAMEEASGRRGWMEREPYAFWKGNTGVSSQRKDLMRCNGPNSSVRAFHQDWRREIRHGFQNSNLANQGAYRYKIYVEGRAWSVSQKYIMASDSIDLQVASRYDDFFTRGLFPLQHYWPIRSRDKCPAIEFAVHWGNANPDKAQLIGRNGNNFIKEQLKMDYVYDYMFHLLNEYAKLLKFKPTIPLNAIEVCEESLMCFERGPNREFMVSSMVNTTRPPPSPCLLPPPYSDNEMRSLLERKKKALRQVDSWEREWRKHNFTF